MPNYAKTLEFYEATIKVKPDYAIAYHYKGVALVMLKRPEEAMPSYEKSIELLREDNDQYILWLCNVGAEASHLGRDDQALKLLNKAYDM